MKNDECVTAELQNFAWDLFNKLDTYFQTRVILSGQLHLFLEVLKDEPKLKKKYLSIVKQKGNFKELKK